MTGVVVSIISYFHPEPIGEMIQVDEHIFEMGWFNHQLDDLSRSSNFKQNSWDNWFIIP